MKAGRREARWAWAFLALGVVGPGCGSAVDFYPDEPLVVPDGCSPLSPDESCSLPYPSDVFRENGRLVMRGAAMLHTAGGREVDLFAQKPIGGASRQPAIVAVLPSAITREGLPGIFDGPEASTNAATSPTLIIDAETGALVPHYVDLDPRFAETTRRALMLHPRAQLRPSARYVVVLRGVKAETGLAQPPRGFLRIRDGRPTPEQASTATRFDADVFPVAERAGVPRAELQLAWDFTTRSREEPIADMLRVRELTASWLASHSPAVTVDSVEDPPGGDVFRWVRGKIAAPAFLDPTQTKLVRDGAGAVVQAGETTFDFLALVPKSLGDAPLSAGVAPPGRLVGFGHGFFGKAESAFHAPDSIRAANGLRAVLIGTDFIGFSTSDLAKLLTFADDPGGAFSITDRVHQAMANWIVLQSVTKVLRELPAFARTTASGPLPLIADTPPLYFGASTSAIMGGTLAGLDPSTSRWVFQVGGAGFLHMVPRSAAFGALDLVIRTTLTDPLATQTFFAMLATTLDPVDPASYLHLLVREPLAGAPADRRYLMQAALGDVSVPNESTYFYARELGLSRTRPSPATTFALPYGIPEADPATLTSGLTLYDYGVDRAQAEEPSAPSDNGGHLGMRDNPASLAQIEAFFGSPSRIIHPCPAACAPR